MSSPVVLFDVLGLATYEGFNKDEEQKLDDALDEAEKILRECRGNCKINNIDDKSFEFMIHMMKTSTYIKGGKHFTFAVTDALQHKVTLYADAFKPNKCCSLPSTLAHESVHLILQPEDQAQNVESECFGCNMGKH